jgi:hypothetical protein
VIQPLLETEVAEVVGTEFVAQEHRELLILPENGIAEVGAEDLRGRLRGRGRSETDRRGHWPVCSLRQLRRVFDRRRGAIRFERPAMRRCRRA